MALNAEERIQIDKAWGFYCRDASTEMHDFEAIKNCLYDNWDTIVDRTLRDIYVADQEAADQVTLNAAQKAELEAQGFTVTAP